MKTVHDGFVATDRVEEYLRRIRRTVEENVKLRALGRRPSQQFKPHMAIVGEPGTGKTQIAKMIGRLYAELGVIPAPHPEDGPRPIVAQELMFPYVGESADRVRMFADNAVATTGVLIIDDAFTLHVERSPANDVSIAVRSTLLALMTARSHELAKFLVGPEKEMRELCEVNPGFRMRIGEHNVLVIRSYSNATLFEMVTGNAGRHGWNIEPAARVAVDKCVNRIREQMGKNFANAWTALDLLRSAHWAGQARQAADPSSDPYLLTAADFTNAHVKAFDN
jgi:ATPase family associated with various cellular activities (AAA)